MNPKELVRVLLIEDQPKDAKRIISMLQQSEGKYMYSIDYCTDLHTGIEFFKNNDNIDVILSDVFFTGNKPTFELLKRIKFTKPIIYITSSEENLAMGAIRSGAQDYLIKGKFDTELLVRTIQYSIERKKFELDLQSMKERLKIVTDNAASSLFMLDEKGITTFMNPAAEDLTGFTFKEINNKPLYNFIQKYYPGSPYANSECPLKMAYSKKKDMKGEAWFTKKNGNVFPVSYAISLLLHHNAIKGAVLEFHDITERKELEQRKEDFITATSHELKTPLTSQRAFIQLLEQMIDKNNDFQYKRYIKKIGDQTDKLARLVNDLLDASKIQGGRLVLNKEKYNMKDIVRDTIEEIQQTTSHMIVLKESLDRLIHTDKERVSQVITNLLTNAIKYSSKEKNIYIIMKEDDHKLVISVQDFGIGIDKENQKKLFQRFFRANELVEQTFPGLGMGLFISHEIVKLLGGKMWVDSTKGKGSTFSFSLPIQ